MDLRASRALGIALRGRQNVLMGILRAGLMGHGALRFRARENQQLSDPRLRMRCDGQIVTVMSSPHRHHIDDMTATVVHQRECPCAEKSNIGGGIAALGLPAA